MKILVVEDCKMTIDFVSEMVREDLPEVELHMVSTREDALAVLGSRNDFNLVFLDWNLPDGNTKWLVQVVQSTQSKLIWVIGISSEENFRRETQIHVEWANDECAKNWIVVYIWKTIEANKNALNTDAMEWEKTRIE